MDRPRPMAKILVIDDDAIVRSTLESILADAGYVVLSAENGALGVALFRSEQPELIITDIIMPEQEGIETITEIRGLKVDAKIIAISGGGLIANADFLKVAKILGAMDTIDKPFDAEELLNIVKNCLAGCARGGNPGQAALFVW
jgi:DNA-binding NtrC family response regulator